MKPEPTCSHKRLDHHDELMPDHGNPPAPLPTGSLDIEILGPAVGEKCGEDCKFTLQVTIDSRMDLADIKAAANPAIGPAPVPCWSAWGAAVAAQAPAGVTSVNAGGTSAWLDLIDDGDVVLDATHDGNAFDCKHTVRDDGTRFMVCSVEVPVACGDSDCNCGGGEEMSNTIEFSVDAVGDPQAAVRGFMADVTMHAAGEDGVCGIAEVTAKIEEVRHFRHLPGPTLPHEFNPANCTWGPAPAP